MQRVVAVTDLRVLRPGVDVSEHLEATRHDPAQQFVARTQAEMLGQIGYTLACSTITKDQFFIEQLEAFSHIERLNIGPVSTMAISWDQPHEGNMFEFLWQRRSIERAW